MDPQSDLIGQRQIRLEKITKLRKLGINPYPVKSTKDHTNQHILDNYKSLKNSCLYVTGRLMSKREHGQLIFCHIQDQSGQIQLYIKSDTIKKTNIKSQNLGFDNLNLLDVGDFVEVYGQVTKTKRGEISILVNKLRILSKAIRPLPDKWKGLQNKEIRFRRRYLDMTMDPDIRQRFIRRSRFWQATRDFLNKHGFVEINIPVLEHCTGGADAKPFVTHLDAQDQDMYLRISHELPLKRLLGGGFDKVYDIGARFRNEGIDDEHLPEHIAMEFYWAYSDYREGMKLTQQFFKYILKETFNTLQFNVRGFNIDLSKHWKELDFETLLKSEYGDKIDIFKDSVDSLKKILTGKKVKIEGKVNRSRVVDTMWKQIRKTIAGPVFVTGIPKFFSPLAKTETNNDKIVQRFFPIIAGSEMANAFSELNDPVDQLNRLVQQQEMRDSGDDEAHMLDIDFVEMLEYGMPPAFGFGMSERPFWAFEGVSARDGVPFPSLKNDTNEVTLKIYKDIAKYLPKR